MKKTALETIKGSYSVYSNGEYVVLPAAKLYILKPDGSLVACRNDLRNAGRITFLSGNRLLLCSSKAVLHMIDLCTGLDLWTAPFEKCNLNIGEFALSPDESFAYAYGGYRDRQFISRVFLASAEHEVDTRDISPDIGATRGILCDEEGIPCLLKTLRETVGGKPVIQNGVRIHDFDGIDPGGTTTWKTKWSFSTRTAIAFFGSTDRILTDDLHSFIPSSGELLPLLTPENLRQLPDQAICDSWTDSTARYLCLQYPTGNVILDLQERSIAARYAADYSRGCLIGREYWISVSGSITRKPFPSFEEIPPMGTGGNMDWYRAEHPELW